MTSQEMDMATCNRRDSDYYNIIPASEMNSCYLKVERLNIPTLFIFWHSSHILVIIFKKLKTFQKPGLIAPTLDPPMLKLLV